MSFFNEVEFIASKVLQDGNEVIVKSKASASSSESYEDAWLKAQDIAKEKAESQLTNLIKSVEEKESNTELIIKGIKGEIGFQGPRGLPGKSGVDGKDLRNTAIVLVNEVTLSENSNRIIKKIIDIQPVNYPTSLKDSISPLKFKELEEEFKKIIDAYPVKYNSPGTQTLFVQSEDSEMADIQGKINSYFSSNEGDLTNAAKIGLFNISPPPTRNAVPRVGPIFTLDECLFEYNCSGTATSCVTSNGNPCIPTCCENSIFGLIFNGLIIGLIVAPTFGN